MLVRNPYFHRVDRGRPPAARTSTASIVSITDDKLIPAKAGAGDVDLQARYLRFDNYTFLKQGEKRNHYRVLLWEKALGSQMALYPNLNVEDPVWQKLMRDVRFRRALSLAINRHEINEVVYFGLGEGVGQHGAAAQPAVPAGIPQRVEPVRPQGAPTRCSTRSGSSKRDAQRHSACCPTGARWRSSSTPPARAPRRPTCWS